MREVVYQETEVSETGTVIRHSVVRSDSSSIQAQPLINTVMRIARRALNASASSILLSEEKGQKFVFAFADGSAGDQIRRLKISKNSGIAGWVVKNSAPVIVNDVYKNKYFNEFTDSMTGYMTSSIICAPLVIHGKVIGVIEGLNKRDGSGFNQNDLNALNLIAATVAQVIENIRRTESSLVTHSNAVSVLLSAVDAMDSQIYRHSRRVSEYVLLGANALSLPKDEQQIVKYAAVLHDVGKAGMPGAVLNKSDALADEELAMIHKHPIIGFNLLKGTTFLEEASKLVLYHHEGYDGRGYPKGLKGETIPLGARLIAVADAFDHMAARESISKKDALTRLVENAGGKFDPAAVKAFNSGFAGSYMSGSNNRW